MELKVIQYGAGKMSKYTMRYALEKGHKIVAAFDINEDVIGKDISHIIETKGEIGTKVSHANEFETYLQNNKADIVIVTTMSLLGDIENVYMLCAKYGVNAISTCEEAFFPQNSNPVLTAKLDELARANNCTLTGCGYQDIYWGNLIAAIAGSTHKITKIKGKSSYNVEDYGIALAKVHGAGLTLEEFDAEVASADRVSEEERRQTIMAGNFAPSYMWSVNGWLAQKLGLTVTHQVQTCVPQIAETTIHSTTLKMDIKKGDATGMSAVVTTNTAEGVVIESECIGKVYNESEFDCNEWTIEGEPATTIVVNRPATVELTCATVVNRLEDVVNSRAGYVATCEWDLPEYKTNKVNL